MFRCRNRPSDDVVVRTLFSGVSRGTESLVFRGGVPESQHTAMRAPFQDGDFPGPVKYGYLNVGLVEEGPGHLVDRTVFCLYPHQSRYVVPARCCDPGARHRPHRAGGAGRNGGDGGERPVGRRTADRRPDRRRRSRRDRLLRRRASRPVPGRPRPAGRFRSHPRRCRPARWASTSRSPNMPWATATSWSTPAPPKPGSPTRWSSSPRRARSWN